MIFDGGVQYDSIAVGSRAHWLAPAGEERVYVGSYDPVTRSEKVSLVDTRSRSIVSAHTLRGAFRGYSKSGLILGTEVSEKEHVGSWRITSQRSSFLLTDPLGKPSLAVDHFGPSAFYSGVGSSHLLQMRVDPSSRQMWPVVYGLRGSVLQFKEPITYRNRALNSTSNRSVALSDSGQTILFFATSPGKIPAPVFNVGRDRAGSSSSWTETLWLFDVKLRSVKPVLTLRYPDFSTSASSGVVQDQIVLTRSNIVLLVNGCLFVMKKPAGMR